MKLHDDINLGTLVEDTPGFVGADLAQLCSEAALGCIREHVRTFASEAFVNYETQIADFRPVPHCVITLSQHSILSNTSCDQSLYVINHDGAKTYNN